MLHWVFNVPAKRMLCNFLLDVSQCVYFIASLFCLQKDSKYVTMLDAMLLVTAIIVCVTFYISSWVNDLC